MADIGFVRTSLAGIKDDTTRRILVSVFEHVLSNLRFGAPENQTRATNLQDYWLQSTTASDTAEFSLTHGLPSAPHVAFVALDLSHAGAKTPVLEVSKAADSKRIYLKAASGSTNAPFTLLIE